MDIVDFDLLFFLEKVYLLIEWNVIDCDVDFIMMIYVLIVD